MTNIQAIDLLKGLEQSLDDYYGLTEKGKTAFHMAITALEMFDFSEPVAIRTDRSEQIGERTE